MKNRSGTLRALLGLVLLPLSACLDLSRAPDAPVVSPRLAALQEDLRNGNAAALGRFWKEVERQGAPLVEPIPGDGRNLLVTFLWRGESKTRGIVILGSVASGAAMSRLPGSDVWFSSQTVRRDARFTYRLAPVTSWLISVNPESSRFDLDKVRAFAAFDPLNPRRFPPGAAEEEWYVLSLVELPGAPPQPWRERRPGVTQGRVKQGHIESRLLQGRRLVEVYRPAVEGKGDLPLLVVSDGWSYSELISLPAILDNLIAAGEIPPLVAVMVNPPDPEMRDTDLACNAAYSSFLAEELIPWVRERYPVTLDPSRTVIAGASLGGLAAACAAVEHPGLFGNVLSQSGSFWWKPEADAEPEELRRRIAKEPRRPVRFYLDVGLMEVGPTRDDGPSLLEANRRLRDALRAKGYPVEYVEFSGGHSYANWQATLPDALRAMF